MASAFLQEMGLIDDYSDACFILLKVEKARKVFSRPQS
jgi:hypothetical protein